MRLLSHAPIPAITRPTSADYTALPQHLRKEFDLRMEKADKAGTGPAYQDVMVRACFALGIAVPESMDIARCDCFNNGCGCGAIFDTALPGVVVTANADPGFNLSRLQCPTCGHDHPRPAAD